LETNKKIPKEGGTVREGEVNVCTVMQGCVGTTSSSQDYLSLPRTSSMGVKPVRRATLPAVTEGGQETQWWNEVAEAVRKKKIMCDNWQRDNDRI